MATEDGNNGSGGSTITTMFSFLIIFLVVFAALVIGGILWHHIVRRRRLARGGPGQVWFTFDEGWANAYAVRSDFGAVPKMWEIETPEGKGIEGKQWKAVQVISRLYLSERQFVVDADLPQPLAAVVERSKEHVLSAAPSEPIPAKSGRLSIFTRLRPTRSQPAPEENPAQEKEAPPEYARAVQVSVLVAMPSLKHNQATSGRASPTPPELAQLGEYAIGMCRAPLPEGTVL